MKHIAPQPWHQSNKDSQEIGDGNAKTYTVSLFSHRAPFDSYPLGGGVATSRTMWRKAKSVADRRGGANYLPLSVPLEYTKVRVKRRREAATDRDQGALRETNHSRVWQRPQFVSKCWPGNSDLGEYLSKTYSNVPEMIIRTKPK